jgi:hypothetical protein
MPIKTMATVLREDREKLKRAASDRMRQKWGATPKIETKAQIKKTTKSTAVDLAARL